MWIEKMGRINIEIPDKIHECLREEKEELNVPMRMIIIETLRERYREQGRL